MTCGGPEVPNKEKPKPECSLRRKTTFSSSVVIIGFNNDPIILLNYWIIAINNFSTSPTLFFDIFRLLVKSFVFLSIHLFIYLFFKDIVVVFVIIIVMLIVIVIVVIFFSFLPLNWKLFNLEESLSLSTPLYFRRTFISVSLRQPSFTQL